ncbi:MAG: Ig domain-containing protein, partial [Gemmatimonadales bacterium]
MIRWSRALTVLASVALGTLTACSGGDSNEPDCDAIAAALVSRIEVEPASATVNLGDSLQLSAVAYSCAGPMSEVNSFTWHSANDGQVSVSSTGLVKAVTSGGAVEIVAAAQGKEGSAAIATRPVPLARVTVEPSTATVGVNRTSTLTARGFDAQGREITGRPVQWSSANIGIVTVDQTGRITGVAPGGPVAVTATIEGQSASAQVSVALVPVSTVTVAPPTATIAAGTTQQFTATIRDELGNALAGRAVNWTSSDPLIASVNASTGLVTGNKPGEITLTATSEGRSGTARVTVSIGAPARLAFVQQPSSVQAGSTMSPAVTVEIQDAAGNRVTTANQQITLASSPSVTVGGNTATAVGGVATFSDITMNTPGAYTLIASSPGLTSATSNGFTVTARPATRLAFVQQPTIDTAGKAITPAITVELQDVTGARVTTSGVPITIAIGNNPGGSTLGGTVTQNTVNGVATFSNLTLNKTGTGYTLTASSPGLTSATSSAFNILPGAPVGLRLVTQPCSGSATCSAGTPLAPSPQFEVLDANGNRVTTGTGSNASVTVARTAGPGSATLGGTTTVTAANGLVTFGNLILNRAGNGYVLTASSNGLTSASTAAFEVVSGSGSLLSITSTIPTSVVSGSTLPAISVQLLDANGNLVT